MHLTCPNCKGSDIGRIGMNQYYCWNCFIELNVQGDRISAYEVEEDGSLSSLNDLFAEEDMRLNL